MTIIEAISLVLKESKRGMTSSEIYKQIINENLYVFGAKNPLSVVNNQIRRRCMGLDFPTACPKKLFEISGYKDKKPLFFLCNGDEDKRNYGTNICHQAKDMLPEEKISIAYKEHVENIKAQVLDCILNNSPSFFEHLVMDLLLKMGYGYDQNSGVVTGRSHDGGIDGIISEDKLGLDLIYIQAKRYSGSNSVGKEEVQAFVGAMVKVQKGVFITTTRFTKGAISFIESQTKNIKLIDGMLLAELLVKYCVGINIVQTITLLKIDSDYYGE